MIKNIKLKDFKVNSFHNKISEDFLILKIKDLGEIKIGNTPSKKDKSNYGNEHNWYTTPDFKDSLLKSSKLKLSVKGFLKARKAKINDILVACIGDLGRVAIVKKEGGFNQQINSISVNENYNYKYIYYFLKNNQDYIKTFSKKNVVDIINKNDFSNIEIYVASDKKEQDKIVEILDKQQSLIDSYKEKLSLLEEQESYYQDELLSGRIRIKLNSENEKLAIDKGFIVNGELVEGKEKEFEEWLSVDFKDKVEFYKEEKLKKVNLLNKTQYISEDFKILNLEEIISIENKNRKAIAAKNRIKGIYPYCGATKIQDYIDHYKFDGEFLLIGEDGADWSEKSLTTYLMNGKFNVNNHAHVLKEKIIPIKYIREYLNNNDLSNYITGAVVKKLTKENLKNIDFAFNKIHCFFSLVIFNDIEKQKNLIKEKIKIEEEKMDYLMDELLSGRIRVE